MKHKFKLCYQVVLIAIFTIGIFTSIKADENIDGIIYKYADGEYTIIGSLNLKGDVCLKDQVNGIRVTSIGENAFDKNNDITGITIESGIYDIGQQAFYGCSNLSKVEILNGVRNIGNYAFADCKRLCTISIPVSVNSIGQYATYGCNKNLLIYGSKGSSAEIFAMENNFDFNVYKPAKVGGVKLAKKSGSSIRITWKKVARCAYYEIYRATSKNGKYKKRASINETIFVDENLTNGKIYYYKIRAVAKQNGTEKCGTFSTTRKKLLKPDPISIKIKRDGAKVNVLWNNNKNNGKYFELFVKQNAGKYKRIGTGKIKKTGLSTNANVLSDGSIYSFKIKTYSIYKNKKVYSDFSNAVIYQ